MNKSKKILHKSLSLFVGTGLVAGNLFQLALPAFAGSLSITNEATGTYDDGSGNSSTTVSNKVEITVEEVPAISINNINISRSDATGTPIGGSLQPGDKLVSIFDVVSNGNDPTKIFIPGVTELNANGSGAITNGSATKVTYQVKDASGANVGAAVELTAAGQTTVESVPVGGKVVVTVLVAVDANAPVGQSVEVKLGNTPDDVNNVLNQNQDRVPAANQQANDVYTVDNADGAAPGEYPGVTTNVREASNKQVLGINATPKPFVKIEKTYGAYSENAPLGPENDTLQYNLKVTVPQTLPTGVSSQLTTDNLYPTFVNGLSGSGQTGQLHVLISDVLPVGTKLTGTPTVPNASWTVVYSTDNATVEAYRAIWTTTVPGDLNTVTRVGYVYTGGASVAKNDTAISGFGFTVKLNSSINAGALIRNLAQVFGEEAGKTPTTVTDPSVYDESGDDTYNNDSDKDGTPDTLVQDTDGTPTGTDDTNNNNTGTGTNGEPNVFTVPTRGILNGTVINNVNHPDALGAGGDNNLDFTNVASPVTPGATPSVPVVSFDNSLKNTSSDTKDLKVTLVASDLTDLPVGTTIITITDPANTNNTVTYSVVQATVGGTPTITITSTQTTPVTFTGVTAGSEVKYQVTVDLPDDAPQNNGYDVPITAFVDTNGDNILDAGDPRNKTIDRVYAGFVTLVKKSQVLDSTGTPVSGANGVLDTSGKTAGNGQRIKFEITYTNISENAPSGGSNNGVLDAKNLKIVEDGVPSGSNTNNWADPTNHINGATVFDSAKFDTTFFNGASGSTADPATNATVTKYESVLKTGQVIAPQTSGSFTFQRAIK